MTDLNLMLEKIKSGDKKAFRDFVEEYKKKMYSFSYHLTGNHEDADDLAQIVFIKFYNTLHLYRQESNLNNWLNKIAVNSFIDKKRRKVDQIMFRFNPDEEGSDMGHNIPSKTPLPDRQLESSLIKNQINNALLKLSPKEKAAFILKHYKGHSLKEIAAAIKTSEGTVKSLLFRAIKKMQQALAFYRPELGMEEN